MTAEFSYLIYLTYCGATGTAPEPPMHSVEWARIFRLAQIHCVDSIVAAALSTCENDIYPEPEAGTILAKEQKRRRLNAVRKNETLRLLKDMTNAGLNFALLKGLVAAEAYFQPESRLSGDTDLLVSPGQEKRVLDYLARQGFYVKERSPDQYHSSCTHPIIGLVEVHVKLYDEIVENIWFRKAEKLPFIIEPAIFCHIAGTDVPTLGLTDHMIYLSLHAVKHFILGDFNLRMIFDIALFYQKHRGEINTERFWDIIGQLHYARVIAAFMNIADIARDDIEPSAAEAGTDEETIRMICDDLEQGESFQMKNGSPRAEGWHEYNRIKYVSSKSNARYRLYMIYWYRYGYLRALFPSRAHLAERYPVIIRRPYLLFFVWIHRLLFHGIHRIFHGALKTPGASDGEASLSVAGKGRLEMFKKLEML